MSLSVLSAADAFWRIRVDDELLTLAPLSTLVIEPHTVRQVFNDTDRDALWLVVGVPPEAQHPRDDSGAARRALSGRAHGPPARAR
jgi:hypothetical protein